VSGPWWKDLDWRTPQLRQNRVGLRAHTPGRPISSHPLLYLDAARPWTCALHRLTWQLRREMRQRLRFVANSTATELRFQNWPGQVTCSDP
jgi:hypothetical protein